MASNRLKNVARMAGCGRHGAQRLRHIKQMGEEASIAQRRRRPTAVVFQRTARVFATSVITLLAIGIAFDGNAESFQNSGVLKPENLPAESEEFAYRVRDLPPESMALALPALPDLSGYTAAAIMRKLVAGPPATVSVRRMQGEPALAEFTGGDERMLEWARRQHTNPRAIFIERGLLTPRDLARLLTSDQFIEVSHGTYLARLPIVIQHGATLHIDKQTNDFRLSEDHGSFLVNDGKLFITDSRVTGWRERGDGPATFRSGNQFRPFIVSWGGTETYISGAIISHLGYSKSRSYGVSLAQYSPKMSQEMKRSRPTGQIINSDFSDNWYGFYCSDAEDITLLGNTLHDNIIYGVFPYNGSKKLIIAENIVYGTKEKQGIFISRGISDSWILGNTSHHNRLSGIAVDQSSTNNVMARNDIYGNGANGLTIHESSNNLIWNNRIVSNRRHGVLVRNSEAMRLEGNDVSENGLAGIYAATKDIRGSSVRPSGSMTVVGGSIRDNGATPIRMDAMQSATLYQVDMLSSNYKRGLKFTGILGQFQAEILDVMVRKKRVAVIEPGRAPAVLTAVDEDR